MRLDQLRSKTYPDPGDDDNGRSKFRRLFKDFLEIVLISVMLFASINIISARVRIESVSMQPTLYAGNFVVVDKLSYKLNGPNRGDVIVFRFPPDPSQDPYIKRVIGLPGEQVRIDDGRVYINEVRISEPYLKMNTQRSGEWTIPEGALFVMGDNRNNSSDSRVWGMLPMVNVIGKAIFVYWPPENWDLLSFSYAAAAEP